MLAKNQPWGLGGSLSLPLRTSAMAARREPLPTIAYVGDGGSAGASPYRCGHP
jgi:hypothetical protein